MQKGRMQYAAAGVQAMPGIRLNVRSNVRLPDSEAGCEGTYAQQPFYAGRTAAAPRRCLTVPARGAAVFLCALAVLFGALILSRVSHKAQLVKANAEMESRIAAIKTENDDMALKVAEARDYARISYEAVRNLGMISENGVEAVLVVARDTRPAGADPAQESSPYSLPEGNMTGSR